MGKTTDVRLADPDGVPADEYMGAHFVKFGEYSPNVLLWLKPPHRNKVSAGYFVTNRAGYSLGPNGRRLIPQETLEKALATERPKAGA